MNADKVFNIAGSLIVLATITVLVTNGAGTSTAVGGIANGFSKALRTAMGR